MIFKNEIELDFSKSENQNLLKEAFKKIDNDKGLVYPIVINGERIKSANESVKLNPGNTSEIIGKVFLADKELANKAIESAYETFQTYRFTPIDQRIEYVNKLTKVLLENRFEINAWIIEDSGKNWAEADGELCEAVDFFNAYCKYIKETEMGIEVLSDSKEKRKCVYKPIGVGLAIPPWNFPFALLAGMVASAILTGNTIVIKPSDSAFIVAYKFFELIEKAGIPNGVVNFLPGKGSIIGDYIVTHPKVSFINFTGSKEVGLRINELASKISDGQRRIKRVVAELGGKNAIIVDSDADLKKAGREIANSAFSYQGQKCSACSRVIVMSDVHDTLVEEIIENIKSKEQGMGKDNMPFGPVISKDAFASITNYIEKGKKEAVLAYGGESDSSKGYYISPTIFVDVKKDAVLANEEVFGPVLAIIKVESFSEAIELANSTEYGLTGSVFTKSAQNIERAINEMEVGNLYINRKSTGAIVMQNPFGGVKLSGTDAKTGTKDYLLNFMELKSITEAL